MLTTRHFKKVLSFFFITFSVLAFYEWSLHDTSWGYHFPFIVPVLCYAFILFLIAFFFTWIFPPDNKQNQIRLKSILGILTGIFLSLSIGEIVLRYSGIHQTYLEARRGLYTSPYTTQKNSWFWTRQPYEKFQIKNTEFTYDYTANSLGLSDVEPVLEKKEKEYRIITLGDSFTEGDGAPFDSSYPQILRQILHRNFPDKDITVLNGGMSGSDPYYNYSLLKEKLILYKPDIVVVSVNISDLTDIFYRGGLNRFQKDGTVKHKPSPWWEPVYAVSHLARVFFSFKYDNGLIPHDRRNKIFTAEIDSLASLFNAYQQLGETYPFHTIILLHPFVYETEIGQYEFDFLRLKKFENEKLSVFDLLNYYIHDLNLSKNEMRNLYWVIDGHHNSKGYSQMANGVYSAIHPIIHQHFKEDSLSVSSY